MLISHLHRYIFIKTRKTAGTSVEIALSRSAGPDDVIGPLPRRDAVLAAQMGASVSRNRILPLRRWRARDWFKAAWGRSPKFAEHSPAWFIKRSVSREIWEGYHKFTIERNSWDLAVSAFFWYRHFHDQSIDFETFVNSSALANYVNWRLYTIDDAVVVDEIIRYDALAESLPQLSDRLGLPELTLPNAKGGFRRDGHYREMYTDETRQRVAKLFKKEIAHFGWAF